MTGTIITTVLHDRASREINSQIISSIQYSFMAPPAEAPESNKKIEKTDLTLKQLADSPLEGSLLCPSPLVPIYDRTVDPDMDSIESRKIPRIMHVSMVSSLTFILPSSL